jgi:hypothetical protein
LIEAGRCLHRQAEGDVEGAFTARSKPTSKASSSPGRSRRRRLLHRQVEADVEGFFIARSKPTSKAASSPGRSRRRRLLHRQVEADVEARFTVFTGRPKVIGQE